MIGLDVLGAVAASIQVIQVTQTTLKFINAVRKTSKHAAEQLDMEFHLLVQAIKFEGWCESLKLSDVIRIKEADPVNWQRSREFVDLRRALGSNLRFDNMKIADLTISILIGLNQKFETAWRILEKHESQPEESPRVDVDQKKQKKWYSISSKKEIQQPKSDVSSPVKIQTAVKWVGYDKKEFLNLLGQISELNTSLVTLLDVERQKRVQRQVSMRILDSTEAQSMSHLDFDGNNELIELINLKTLLQAKDEEAPRSRIVQSSNHVRIYSLVDFRDEVIAVKDTRSIFRYGAETVLVEWRYHKEDRSKLQGTARLFRLVELLSHAGLSEKFMTPNCTGLVEDSFKSRIGLVFSTSLKSAQPDRIVQYHDLQLFIMSSPSMPSVTDRILIAKNLATSISNLHSVQWLHKSIRSDNIVFFEDPGQNKDLNSSGENLSKSVTRTMTNSTEAERLTAPRPFSLPFPYILGWDLSRPDDPSELSQSRARPSEENIKNMILYSHPDAHSYILNAHTSRYRVQFDIYSLGLVLLEIGLWRTLHELRRKCAGDEDFRMKLKDEYCDKLQSRMGLIYWRATQRCIANDFDLQNVGPVDKGSLPLQSAFEQQVVSELARCVA